MTIAIVILMATTLVMIGAAIAWRIIEGKKVLPSRCELGFHVWRVHTETYVPTTYVGASFTRGIRRNRIYKCLRCGNVEIEDLERTVARDRSYPERRFPHDRA
jgi:hypothetical protein